MKTLLSVIISLSLIIAIPAFAKKPPWAGHGGRNRYQYNNQNSTENHTENLLPAAEQSGTAAEKDKKKKKEKISKKQQKHKKAKKEEIENQEKEQNKGLEKQREMKAEQEQKELDQGSEQGQESRQKRKKWWKFGQ